MTPCSDFLVWQPCLRSLRRSNAWLMDKRKMFQYVAPQHVALQFWIRPFDPRMTCPAIVWQVGTATDGVARQLRLTLWNMREANVSGFLGWYLRNASGRIPLGCTHPIRSSRLQQNTVTESKLVINNCMALGKPILRLPEVEWLHTRCDFHSGILQVQWLACPLPRRRLAPLLGILVHRTGCWWGNLPFHASRKVYF